MRIRWRGLQLPSKIVPEKDTLRDDYGKFVIEPFERGFGTTIGNSLRRVLLSSLEGSAVIGVQIKGVDHEFSTLQGVYEDVPDIILNLKALVVKNHAFEKRVVKIVRDRKGEVTAADIQHDESIEIIDPTHHICELTDDVKLEMEITIETSRGYVPTEEMDLSEAPMGFIPIDAAYAPVTRVAYRTEEARIGQKANYDRLILEIWTNGTVTPEMALVEGAKILRKHLNPFVQYSQPGQEITDERVAAEVAGPQEYMDPELETKLDMSLAELELSVRATNCLESEGITKVRELVSRAEDDLLTVRNFGETTLREVREKLAKFDLRLGMNVPATK